MLSPELKSKINALWDKFWSRGLSNPIQSIEQMSYLFFLRRLEQTDQSQVEKTEFSGGSYTSIFAGDFDTGEKTTEEGKPKPVLIPKEKFKWSLLKQVETAQRFEFFQRRVFSFLKSLNAVDSPFARGMENAMFILPNPSLLEDAMLGIDEIYEAVETSQQGGQEFQDTQGDVYEYLLSELKEAGKNGQFRTPRHLIRFLVELVNPQLNDTICDPASGTGGFLLAAYQHILAQNSTDKYKKVDDDGFFNGKGDKIKNDKFWKQLRENTFYGYDIDPTMVRIGMMNLMLHGIGIPNIENKDTLSKRYDEQHQNTKYKIILANPPFTGKISDNDKSSEFRVSTKSTELLFMDRIIKMLDTGGRAGVIIPEGVLFGSTKANKTLREVLLKDCQLDAVISLPSGVFKPYTGVKTAILLFTKGLDDAQEFHTDRVWFYELTSDGYSLDDNRRRLKDEPLPVAITGYKERKEKSAESERKGKHFYVPLAEIKENDYNLSFNRYKEFVYEEQTYDPPKEILANLLKLEKEILNDMEELNGLLG